MKIEIVEDSKFRFKRVEPIPTQEEVDKFYAKEFYDANAEYFNNSALLLQQEQSDFFNSRWKAIYEQLHSFFGSEIREKSVFDIGFGFAQALIYLKNKGLLVSGLEPSKEGVDYARGKGIDAIHGGIENFDLVKNKSDIVLLLNVLEHLRQPEKTILDIKNNLLTSDGLLLIDVPNDFNDFQIVANEEYNLNEWWVHPPNHINYFSHESLQKLLEGCGFKIVHCTSSFPLDMFLLFGDQYVGNSELGRECHNKRVRFEQLMEKHGKAEKLNMFYNSLAELNLGRSISIYATPA
ncbi:class I SAM-dependent methyltransferase [Alphaproteobacteria bacterium]|nr:class I SAM-dependent methyltransferase [Alphaproteobacteria bacterium]